MTKVFGIFPKISVGNSRLVLEMMDSQKLTLILWLIKWATMYVNAFKHMMQDTIETNPSV